MASSVVLTDGTQVNLLNVNEQDWEAVAPIKPKTLQKSMKTATKVQALFEELKILTRTRSGSRGQFDGFEGRRFKFEKVKTEGCKFPLAWQVSFPCLQNWPHYKLHYITQGMFIYCHSSISLNFSDYFFCHYICQFFLQLHGPSFPHTHWPGFLRLQ